MGFFDTFKRKQERDRELRTAEAEGRREAGAEELKVVQQEAKKRRIEQIRGRFKQKKQPFIGVVKGKAPTVIKKSRGDFGSSVFMAADDSPFLDFRQKKRKKDLSLDFGRVDF